MITQKVSFSSRGLPMLWRMSLSNVSSGMITVRKFAKFIQQINVNNLGMVTEPQKIYL